MSISHRIVRWEKKYGFIGFPKGHEHEILEFFPEGEFTVIAFGERLEKRRLDRRWRRLFIGKPLKDNPNVTEGSTVTISRVSEREFRLDLTEKGQPTTTFIEPLHEKIIGKWCVEQRSKFGPFEPKILRNVNLNEILPQTVSLKENVKTVDGYAVLEIGGVPIHTSVLEVQHKGVREDTVVRVSLILPFVSHVDIIADNVEDLAKIKELLERLSDPNIVKAKLSFQTFTDYLLKK
jgi:hypothetical protein